jgi:DNA-3-methyladenine glycosylase II
MGSSFSFEIEASPPFRLDLTAWALRRRPRNIVDRWDGKRYSRVLVIEGCPVHVSVSQPVRRHATLHISLDGVEPTHEMRAAVAGVVETMLGTRTKCNDFYTMAARNDEVHRLSNRFLGLKPPRFASVFEALVNGIACQQLSLDVGINLLNRLAEEAGEAITLQTGVVYAFPVPRNVCRLTDKDLWAMGFSRQKARSLLDLAEAIVDG